MTLLPMVMASGCIDRPTTIDFVPVRPHRSVKLRMVVTRSHHGPLVAEVARSWGMRTGAEVEVVAGTADDSTADIILLPPVELPKLASRDRLAEVPLKYREVASAYRWEDIFPVYQTRLLAYGGKVLGLPVAAEGMVLVYRNDLIDPSKLPRTWDELAGTAEALGAGSLTPVNPPEFRAAEYFSAAASYDRLGVSRLSQGELIRDDFFTFQFDMLTGKSRLASPAFRHAAEVFARMAPFRCRDVSGSGEALRLGKAKLGVIPLSELGKVGDEMAGKLGIAPIPGTRFTFDATGNQKPTEQGSLNRVPYLGWGGLIAVVPKAARSAEAAWSFAAELGAPDRSALEIIADVRWGAGTYRISQVDARARARWASYGLTGPETDRLPAALRENLAPGVQNYRLCFRSPDQELFARALDAELLAIMRGDKPGTVGITSAHAAWEALIATVPPDVWRTNLRKSLGLN